MNEQNYHSASVNMFYPDLLDSIAYLNTKKFHQNASFFLPMNNYRGGLSHRLTAYLNEVAQTIPLIENDMKTIDLGVNEFKHRGSGQVFAASLEYSEIAQLFGSTFGVDLESKHRSYASAGGLFPIYAIFVNLKSVDRIPRGAYFYDGVSHSLKMIDSLDSYAIEDAITLNSDPKSDQLIVYVGDLKKVFYKYQYAGYKHLFIESGLQLQRIREQGSNMSEKFIDLPYSGFKHNALMDALKLSKEDLIISVIQWIGKE